MKEVSDFAASLQLAAKTLQFYSAEHPRSVEAVESVEKACTAMLASRTRIGLTAAKGTLLADGDPIVPLPPQAKVLATEMEKRQIGGIIIAQGVTRRELLTLTQLIALRPEQIKQRGGSDEIMRAAEVKHVRLSHVRYEAITEDEEVVWSKSVRRGQADAPEDAAAQLPGLLQQYLLAKAAPIGSGGAEKASGAGAGDAGGSGGGSGEGAGEGSGDSAGGVSATDPDEGKGTGAEAYTIAAALTKALGGDDGPIPASRARAVLEAAVAALDPMLKIAFIMGLDRLPAGPERDALKSAGTSLLISGVASGGSGMGASSETDAITALSRALAQPNDQIELLRDRLADLGVTREQLDELLGVISWDRLTTADKMAKLLESNRIFEFPPHKLLNFFRELIESGQHGELQRLIEHYAKGLEQPSFFIRQTVSDMFAQIARFIRTPGLNAEVEQIVGRAILNHLVRETDPRMLSTVADAAATFIGMMVATNRADMALRVLGRVDAAVSVAPAGSPLHQAREALRQAFDSSERAGDLLAQVGSADAETLARAILPLVTELGDVLAPHVIEHLGNEEDRNRRGRLVRALKAIGSPAFPVLLASLESSTWYVVRNTLNVLSDIGTQDHVEAVGKTMKHTDARVRRAAARTLGRIGGFEAEALLVGAVNDKNGETQAEVLVCLGNLKAQSAIGTLADLARGRLLGDEKVRELAITTLGQIGSDAAIPPLVEILRPKGMFGRDTNHARGVAARALAAIGTDASRAALQAAAAGESDRATRELITRLIGA